MNELSELEEENRRLKAENELSKKLIEKSLKYFDKLDRWDAKTDDNTDERPKPDYTALLEELEFNDKMAGKETTKEVSNEIPPIYQKLLNELRENDEMLGKQ